MFFYRCGSLRFDLGYSGLVLTWGEQCRETSVVAGMRKSRGQMFFAAPKINFRLNFLKRPVPVTASYEDDLIELARSEPHEAFGRHDHYKLYERTRFLHSFAVYRWYRASLRWLKSPAKEPAVFGDLEGPSPIDRGEG